MTARAGLALVALLALLWLGVATRDLFLQRSALNHLSFHLGVSPAEFDRRMHDLRRADLLNPDESNRLYRASFYVDHGRFGPGRALAEEAVRSEPDNIDAWAVLLRATTGHDPARAAQALAEVRRLNPLAGRPPE
jgi:hypothetical protein